MSEKFLRLQSSANQAASSGHAVAQLAPIFMAALVESVALAYLQAAANVAKDNKRQTISMRHLVLATAGDADLTALTNELNVHWLGGGVVPGVHKAVLPDKSKQRKLAAKRRAARKAAAGEGTEGSDAGATPASATPTPGGSHKFLPGTLALRAIVKYQKSTGLLQRKEHFKRLVREQGAAHLAALTGEPVADVETSAVHYSSGVIEYLQLYVEDRVSTIVRAAIDAMAHAGRETLEASDIQLVWRFMCPTSSVDPISTVGIDNLAKPGLHRLALRGSAKRLGESAYDALRNLEAYYVSRVISTTIVLMHRQNCKTMSIQLLRRGASFCGINLPIDVTKRRPARSASDNSSDTASVAEVPVPEEEEGLSDDE
jgi:histone H2A